jgi:hypothetical protein
MYLLYEGSILVSGVVYRRRERRATRDEPAPDAAPRPEDA